MTKDLTKWEKQSNKALFPEEGGIGGHPSISIMIWKKHWMNEFHPTATVPSITAGVIKSGYTLPKKSKCSNENSQN